MHYQAQLRTRKYIKQNNFKLWNKNKKSFVLKLFNTADTMDSPGCNIMQGVTVLQESRLAFQGWEAYKCTVTCTDDKSVLLLVLMIHLFCYLYWWYICTVTCTDDTSVLLLVLMIYLYWYLYWWYICTVTCTDDTSVLLLELMIHLYCYLYWWYICTITYTDDTSVLLLVLMIHLYCYLYWYIWARKYLKGLWYPKLSLTQNRSSFGR